MRIVTVAKVVVVNPVGQVLLLRRSKTDPRRPGEWDFPGGGVETTESIVQGIARELSEEAGISVPETEFKLIYTATEFYEPASESVNRFLFVTHVDEAAASRVVLSFEHEEFSWVSVEQALRDFPHPFYGAGLRYAFERGLLN